MLVCGRGSCPDALWLSLPFTATAGQESFPPTTSDPSVQTRWHVFCIRSCSCRWLLPSQPCGDPGGIHQCQTTSCRAQPKPRARGEQADRQQSNEFSRDGRPTVGPPGSVPVRALDLVPVR